MEPVFTADGPLYSRLLRLWQVSSACSVSVPVRSPVWVSGRYIEILAVHHTGEAILAGISEFRPLIYQLVTDVSEVDAIASSIAFGLLAGICVAGLQEGAGRSRVLFAAPALVACWSLMTFYHLTYGFVILLPVLMLLALHDGPRSGLRVTLFWMLQLGMMFDVPGWSRRAGLADTALHVKVLAHADRAADPDAVRSAARGPVDGSRTRSDSTGGRPD